MVRVMNLFSIFGSLFGGGRGGRYSVSQQTQQNISSAWESVTLALQQKSPSQLRQALITADKCLDNALRDIMPGETMGERLKAAKDRFDYVTYNKIWEAHKMRNNLVHEAGYEPPHYTLTDSIEKLRRGLSALGVKV